MYQSPKSSWKDELKSLRNEHGLNSIPHQNSHSPHKIAPAPAPQFSAPSDPNRPLSPWKTSEAVNEFSPIEVNEFSPANWNESDHQSYEAESDDEEEPYIVESDETNLNDQRLQNIDYLYIKLHAIPLPSFMQWENTQWGRADHHMLKIKRVDKFMISIGIPWTLFTLFFLVIVVFTQGVQDLMFGIFLLVFIVVGLGLIYAGLYPFIHPTWMLFRATNGRIETISGSDRTKIQTLYILNTRLITEASGARVNNRNLYNLCLKDNLSSVVLLKNLESHVASKYAYQFNELLIIAKHIYTQAHPKQTPQTTPQRSHMAPPPPPQRSHKRSSFEDFYQSSCR